MKITRVGERGAQGDIQEEEMIGFRGRSGREAGERKINSGSNPRSWEPAGDVEESLSGLVGIGWLQRYFRHFSVQFLYLFCPQLIGY